MLEDPSEIDDIAKELRQTPIDRQSEGSLRLYLDQLSLAEDALERLIGDQGDPAGRFAAKIQTSSELRRRIGVEIEHRAIARGTPGAKSPFTDDAARNRYAANDGNWASETAAPFEAGQAAYSRSALLWTAVIAFGLGVLVGR